MYQGYIDLSLIYHILVAYSLNFQYWCLHTAIFGIKGNKYTQPYFFYVDIRCHINLAVDSYGRDGDDGVVFSGSD